MKAGFKSWQALGAILKSLNLNPEANAEEELSLELTVPASLLVFHISFHNFP